MKWPKIKARSPLNTDLPVGGRAEVNPRDFSFVEGRIGASEDDDTAVVVGGVPRVRVDDGVALGMKSS